jgi:hypothetical protein
MVRRRQFLAGLAVAGTITVCGCAADGDNTTLNRTSTTQEQTTHTSRGTPEEFASCPPSYAQQQGLAEPWVISDTSPEPVGVTPSSSPPSELFLKQRCRGIYGQRVEREVERRFEQHIDVLQGSQQIHEGEPAISLVLFTWKGSGGPPLSFAEFREGVPSAVTAPILVEETVYHPTVPVIAGCLVGQTEDSD